MSLSHLDDEGRGLVDVGVPGGCSVVFDQCPVGKRGGVGEPHLAKRRPWGRLGKADGDVWFHSLDGCVRLQALNGALDIRPGGRSHHMKIPGRAFKRANDSEIMTGGNVADLLSWAREPGSDPVRRLATGTPLPKDRPAPTCEFFCPFRLLYSATDCPLPGASSLRPPQCSDDPSPRACRLPVS